MIQERVVYVDVGEVSAPLQSFPEFQEVQCVKNASIQNRE